MAQLDLNVNPANDDMGAERRRQLKLSFQADSIKTTPAIIKSPPLPDRTRYFQSNIHNYVNKIKKNYRFNLQRTNTDASSWKIATSTGH